MSPDWDAKPTTVPYANFVDPQTLNLYAYVENSPVDRVDADGHAANTETTANNWVSLGYATAADYLYGLVQWHDAAQGSNPLDGLSRVDLARAHRMILFAAQIDAAAAQPAQAKQQDQQKNVNNDAVGKTPVGNLSKVLTNEIGSLSTPKGGNPKELRNGANAIANALLDNAYKTKPNKVAPDTGTVSSFLSGVMQAAYTNRANGGSDPVGGRTFYGTSHLPPSRLTSRPIGSGRLSVFESFGPFNDSWSGRTAWIYIYNNPRH